MEKFIELLSKLLHQDLAELDTLSRLLDDEKDAVRRRDVAQLQQLADAKQKLIGNLEQRAKNKATLLAKSPLKVRPGEVRDKLASLNNAELLKLWDEAYKSMAHCKQRNLLNGKIISLSLQRTHRLMDLLRGQGNQVTTYGNKGNSQHASGSTTIARA